MLECGLDLKLFGSELDRIGTEDLVSLLKNLKEVYEINGHRWRHLSINTETGEILYAEAAPWMMINATTGPASVEVRLAAWANHGTEVLVTLGESHLFDDPGPFTLILPFSVRQGALVSKTTGESYTLWNLVPRKKRMLGQRPSDERGATCLCRKTYAEAKLELKDKRLEQKKVVKALYDQNANANSPKVGTEGATKEVHGKTLKPGAKGKAAPPVKAASMASKSASSAASTLETKEAAEKAGEDKEDDESEPGSPIHND